MQTVDEKKKFPSVTQRERDLVFEVSHGVPQALNWIWQFRALWHRAQDIPYFEMLEWLRKQKIVAHKFVQWIEIEHDRSPVNAVSYLRKQIFKDHKKRDVFAKGKRAKY